MSFHNCSRCQCVLAGMRHTYHCIETFTFKIISTLPLILVILSLQHFQFICVCSVYPCVCVFVAVLGMNLWALRTRQALAHYATSPALTPLTVVMRWLIFFSSLRISHSMFNQPSFLLNSPPFPPTHTHFVSFVFLILQDQCVLLVYP